VTQSVWHFSAIEAAKVLNSPEDAHLKSMSTFEADEHLQAI
jgi:hypothetical protein